MGYILAILTAISAFLEIKKFFSDKSGSKFRSKLEFKLLIKPLLILAIFICVCVKECSDNKEKTNAGIAQEKRDSINASNYRESLEKYSLKQADSLKAFSRRNSDSLKSFSKNIIKLLASYSLKYDSTSNQIKKAIQNVNSEEPTITEPIDNDLVQYDIQGTKLKIKIRFANYSESSANDCNIKIFVLIEDSGLFYSFEKPIWYCTEKIINSKFILTADPELNSTNPVESGKGFSFLIVGDYKTNNGKIKTVCLYYYFDEEINKFVSYANCDMGKKRLQNSIKKSDAL